MPEKSSTADTAHLELPWRSSREPSAVQKKPCECALCQRGREFGRHIARLSPARQAYFNALYDHLLEVESELDWERLDRSAPITGE